MFKFIGILFFFIVFALIIGMMLIGSLLRSVFGFGRQTRTDQDPRQPGNNWQTRQADSGPQPRPSENGGSAKKFFDKNEGEYVDFEEVDEKP